MCGRVNQWKHLLCHQDRSINMCPLNIAKLHVLVSIQHNLTAIKTQEMTGNIHLELHPNLISCVQMVNSGTSYSFGID
jgi:hypothetical protein